MLMELYIDPNWTFKQSVIQIKALKTQYKGFLTSFSYFQMKELVAFKKKTRDSIYSLNFEEWKCDKLWNYLNDFETYDILQKLK